MRATQAASSCRAGRTRVTNSPIAESLFRCGKFSKRSPQKIDRVSSAALAVQRHCGEARPNRGGIMTHRKNASDSLASAKKALQCDVRCRRSVLLGMRPRRNGVGKMVLVGKAPARAMRGMHGYACVRGQNGNERIRLGIIHGAVRS